MANNAVEWGFSTLADHYNERVQNVGVDVIETALQQTAEMYNREWMGVAGVLVEETVKPKESYRVPGAGTLQPLDEQGVPQVRKGFTKIDVAYPIQRAGDAWGTTLEARVKMTVQELQAHTLDVLRRDYDWMTRHALAALLDNTSWSYADDDDNWGTLVIKPLANSGNSGDTNAKSDTYPVSGASGVAAGTDDHYLASASALSDSNDHYATLFEELDEHPGNAGPYVAYIPQNLVGATRAMRDFYPPSKPMINYGTDVDLAGDIPAELMGFGDMYIGTVGDTYIVRARRVPSSYIIMVAAGADKVLAMRQHPEAELQGLQPYTVQVNSNFQKVDYYRRAGFGVRNRVGAAVMYLGGASYTVPTGYDAPLKV